MTTSGIDRSNAGTNTPESSADHDKTDHSTAKHHQHVAQNAVAPDNVLSSERPQEHGGQAGLEPTRYGDWEKKGRCTDF